MELDTICKIKNKFSQELESLPKNHHKSTMKQLNKCQSILNIVNEWENIHNELSELHTLSTDADVNELVTEEINLFKQKLSEKENELINILIIDEGGGGNAIVEIRAGTGGDEASLFVQDLLNMYSNYALTKKWKVEIIEKSLNDIGIKSVVMIISGSDVYQTLQLDAGVHRVQRIPVTEANDRIHTSTATVAVIPEVDNTINITINPADLQIDTFRSSGAGGQHVNKTESAVRITHIPSGIVTQCQDERSQHENKRRCLRDLEIKLYKIAKEKQQQEADQQRLGQIGTGSRCEKIRTYNFPQNRITDHRWNGVTLYQLDTIINGDMENLLQEVHKQYKNDIIQSIGGMF